jgi:drug/metabolite transporter (DMT)-like permease
LAEFLIIWSISLLGGAEAAFIEISCPLWTIVFSFLLLKFVPNAQVIFGGILIIIGSYIISKYSGIT